VACFTGVFQVEPILWLQHHGGAAWHGFMSVVSTLGLSPAYAAFIIGVAFFVRMRTAILLVSMLLVTAVLVDGAKIGFALPRPDHVDARVVGQADALLERGGAVGPWALLPPDTVAVARSLLQRDWGFPSGHVASATTFALAIRSLLQWRGAGWFASLWIPLMALSRLSLGRHFVADVLGGFVLGLGVFVVGSRVHAWLDTRPSRADRARSVSSVIVVLVVAIAWWTGVVNPRIIGSLAGVALVAWVMARQGWPPLAKRPWQRGAQCTVALLVHGGGMALLAWWSPPSGLAVVATAAVVAAGLLLPHRLVRG
jgi:membrane-associated phospholipid phosphatase